MGSSTSFVHRTFESAGANLHYLHQPNPGKPVLVGLAGFQETANAFFFLEPYLRPNFELYFLDWRGHGASPALAEGTYSLSTLLYDLAMFDISVLPDSYFLLGHCIGADMAALWSALRSDRVRATILIEGLVTRRDDQDRDSNERGIEDLHTWRKRLQFSKRTVAARRPAMQDEQEAARALAWMHPGLGQDQYSALARLLTRRRDDNLLDWHYAADFPTRWPPVSVSSELVGQIWEKIECPVLWLTSTEGDSVSAHAAPSGNEGDRAARIAAIRTVSSRIRRLEHHAIDAPGNGIHNARPHAVMEQIRGFFGRMGLDSVADGEIDAQRLDAMSIRVPSGLPVLSSTAVQRPERLAADAADLGGRLRAVLTRSLAIPDASLDMETPFSNLGFDSLGAVRLLAGIQSLTSQPLSLSHLVEFPTPAALTRFLSQNQAPISGATDPAQRDAPSSPALIALRTMRSRRPLFFAADVMGAIAVLMPLALRLSAGQPFYACQPPGFDGREVPLTRVEELAARFIDEICRVQPHGPFLLGGYSFGGLVAYEAAVQLRARGVTVTRVILLDTPNIRMSDDVLDEAAARTELLQFLTAFSGADKKMSRVDCARASMDEQYTLLQQAMHLTEESPDAVQRIVKLYQAHRIALARYRPPPTDIPVTLFVPNEGFPDPAAPSRVQTDTAAAWQQVCAASLDVVRVAGNHFTMLQTPGVDEIAACLNACLREDYLDVGQVPQAVII